MKKKKTILILLIASLLSIVAIATMITRIVKQTWPQDIKPFKLYYSVDPYDKLKQMGLYSIDSNGGNNKVLFKQKVDGFKLNPLDKSITVISEKEIYKFNENGEFINKIYQGENKIKNFEWSFDQKHLMVFTHSSDKLENDKPRFYLIDKENLKTDEINHDDLKFHSIHDTIIKWDDNSRDIIFIGTKIYSKNNIKWFCYKYDVEKRKTKLIKTSDWLSISQREFYKDCGASASIDTHNQDQEKNKISVSSAAYEYHGYRPISPDGTKTLFTDKGSVILETPNKSSTPIIKFWFYDSKYNRGFYMPEWLPDNRQAIVRIHRDTIYVLDTKTKKYKKLTNAWDVNWFNEQ